MISVTKQNVPDYLKLSPLYEQLFQDAEDGALATELAIEIPADCFKQSPAVHNEEDLQSLLRSVRFWLIPEYIDDCADVFLCALSQRQFLVDALPEFGSNFPILNQLITATEPHAKFTIMGNAARLGLLSFIKYLRLNGHSWDCGSNNHFTSIAAEFGHSDCLQYALDSGCEMTGNECRVAAEGGHVECLKLARKHGGDMAGVGFEIAFRTGHLPLLQYLVETTKLKVSLSAKIFAMAAQQGHLHMLQYLLSVGCPMAVGAANCAAAGDHLDCLQFLHESGCPVVTATAMVAVHSGSLCCVKYLHAIGCPWAANTLHSEPDTVGDATFIARGRHFTPDPDKLLACFMFAAEHGCPLSVRTYTLAVVHDLPEFIEYLHDRGVPLEDAAGAAAGAVNAAVDKCRDECLQLLLDFGCPCDASACIKAIQKKSLPVLMCLHEHGVAWDESVTIAAAEQGSIECLQYLLENGCPSGVGAYFAAVQRGRRDAARCIRSNGMKWDVTVTTSAAKQGFRKFLQHLLEEGCPCDFRAYIAAVVHGNFGCVACLHVYKVPWDETVTLAAAKHNRPEILLFLLQWSCPCSSSAYIAAIRVGSLRCVEVLHSFAVPWDKTVTAAAVAHGRDQILLFLTQSELGVSKDPQHHLQASRDILSTRAYWEQVAHSGDQLAASAAAAVLNDDHKALHLAVSSGYVLPVDIPANMLAVAPRCATFIAMHERKVERSAKRKATEQLQPSIVDN